MSSSRSWAASSAVAVLLFSALAFAQAEEAPEEYQPPSGVPMSPEPSHVAAQQEASDHRWLIAMQPRLAIGLSGNGELPRVGYGFGLNIGRALLVRGAVRLGIGASFAYDRVAYDNKQDSQQNLTNSVGSIAHASFSADLRLDALLLAGRIRPWAMLGPALSVATYSEPAPTPFSSGPSSTHALPALRAAVGLAGLVWRSLELGAHLEWLVTFDGPSLGTPPVQPLTPGTFSVGLDVGFRFSKDSPMAKSDGPLVLVWLDFEMTGLDATRDVILDVAAIVTGADLVERGRYAQTVWQPESALAGMDPYVREMHDKSGLATRVGKSQKGLRDVEKELFALIHAHAGPGEAVLAGNSIHADRRFIAAYMPLVDRYLSYRLLDVTSVKILKRAWYAELEAPVKKGAHTALADVEESIAELAWYREAILRKPTPSP